MDWEKFLSDVLLDSTQEVRMERRKVATELFVLYDEFVKAGFNDDQALSIILTMVARRD